MALGRNALLFLSASAMARQENKSLKKWCRERDICVYTIYKLADSKPSRLSAVDKVFISMFNNKNPEINEYKEKLLQMV